jgi:hypothetical protein
MRYIEFERRVVEDWEYAALVNILPEKVDRNQPKRKGPFGPFSKLGVTLGLR